MKKVKHIFNEVVGYVSRLICPPRCVCCDEIFDIDSDCALCPRCTEEILSRIEQQNSLSINNDNFIGLMHYSSWYAHKLISHAKYTSSKPFLTMIANMFYKRICDMNLQKRIDVISFSPRRPSQIRLYGFDQSEEMAKALSEVSGIPYRVLLKRHKYSRAQKQLTHDKRTENVKGKFLFNGDVNGKSVLLIDDVITTGSTLRECAKILRENGATQIYALSIATNLH